MSGPLAGLRVVEFAGVGPGPMAGMLLADLGAQVIRVDRLEPSGLGLARPDAYDLPQRGKRGLRIDLKRPAGLALARALVAAADALIEGFRPGTMERLGLGPEACLALAPRLVYGRVTGYGQDGPLSLAAGHDLNYIALAGALHGIGREDAAPTPPLNLVGDYGGGAMLLAFGLVCALLSARNSGRGQVVDAAMVEGAATLMTPFFGWHAAGLQAGPRGTNELDSGAPYYEVYRCADGGYLSVAPIEPKFRRVLVDRLATAGADPPALADFDDRARWPAVKERLAAIFATRPRDAWCALFDGSDACVAPVLTTREAPAHPHPVTRGSFVDVGGVAQPAPAPRFSLTPAARPEPPETAAGGAAAAQWARAWGVSPALLQAAMEDAADAATDADPPIPGG